MNTAFVRKPSSIECFYMDLSDLGNNLTFSYWLELDRVPSLSVINSALQETFSTHPGTNIKFYRGAWYQTETIPTCTVTEFDGDNVYDRKPPKIDFRDHTFSLEAVHMTKNDKWYLCFSFFHGCADGRSGVEFIYDFFSVLNGTSPEQNDFSVIDYDIAKSHKCEKVQLPLSPVCAPTSWSPDKKKKANFKIIKTAFCKKFLAAKLSAAVAKNFVHRAIMMIPVDIRKYSEKAGKKLFGNLVLPIFVDADREKSIESLGNEIRENIQKKTALDFFSTIFLHYRKAPAFIRMAILRILIAFLNSKKKFAICALISNVGTIYSEKIKNKYFEIRDFLVQFENFPVTAFSLVSVRFKESTNTSVSWNSGRVPSKIAHALFEDIKKMVI